MTDRDLIIDYYRLDFFESKSLFRFERSAHTVVPFGVFRHRLTVFFSIFNVNFAHIKLLTPIGANLANGSSMYRPVAVPATINVSLHTCMYESNVTNEHF